MTTVVPTFGPGPVTYEVVEVVDGGQVVEGRTGGKIGVAANGSTTVLGVAVKKAAPTVSSTGTTAAGYPYVDVSAGLVTPFTPVLSSEHVRVTFSAACAFGKAVKSTGSGKVGPWVSGTDAADLIIGTCREPGGVANANDTGIIKVSR